MFRELARARAGMRANDIAESRQLLWELMAHEPTVLQCLGIVEATCLSQGIFCKIDGERCGEDFQRFVTRHYTPFCRQALRAMIAYGFVPWHVRRIEGGDEVPEVIPMGTFTWTTEVPSVGSGAPRQERDAGLVTYRVRLSTQMGLKDEDVQVFTIYPPSLDVSVNSILYATVPSPMAHVLTDYKNLRQAQLRRSHADAWNTTAKLICSFKPNVRVQASPCQPLSSTSDADPSSRRRRTPGPRSWTSRTTPTSGP
jgi:hypothetical protein